MKAVILADGEGENLKPVTCTVPESCLPVFGRPLLCFTLEKILSAGFEEVTLLLNYKSKEILSLFPDNNFENLKLKFVFEEESYGTAGNIKYYLPDTDESILFIDGNVYFEENLKNIVDFHKNKNNDCTVISSKNSESGSICIAEPCVFEKIADNKFCEMYDLKKLIIKNNLKFEYFYSKKYFIKIDELSDYKMLLFDTLDKKTNINPPCSSDGIYSFNTVPSGDYMIIPPAFFGKNVQIENGAIIGPYSVISDGCLISKGAKISHSVLLKNIYISSVCKVNGSLLCDGVSVKHNASIFENSVVAEDSVIGEDAVINEGVLIWPKKTVTNAETVTENIKYSPVVTSSFNISSVISGDFGIELTPEKTAKLGAALGTLFEKIRIGVGIDGENNSLALKCGLLGGLISTGAKSFDFGKCFNSQMFYYSSFCDIDVIVYIKGGNEGAVIYLYEKSGIPFSSFLLRKLETVMKHSDFKRCSPSDCRNVSIMSSMEQMYVNEVVRQFDFEKCDYEVSVISSEKHIVDCVYECLNRIGCSCEGENLFFKINNLCTRLSVTENNKSFNHEKILAVVSYNELLKGNDIVLPWDAPQIITTLADSTGGNVYRYSDEDLSKDCFLKHTEKQLWSRDALFLMFKLLSIMYENNCSVSKLTNELPDFYIVKKVIETEKSISDLSNKMLINGFTKDKNEEKLLRKNNSDIKIKKCDNDRRLRIIAEAVSVEAAEELCSEIENLL